MGAHLAVGETSPLVVDEAVSQLFDTAIHGLADTKRPVADSDVVESVDIAFDSLAEQLMSVTTSGQRGTGPGSPPCTRQMRLQTMLVRRQVAR